MKHITAIRTTALVSLPSALLAADVDMDGLDDAFETNTGTSPANPDGNTFVISFI